MNIKQSAVHNHLAVAGGCLEDCEDSQRQELWILTDTEGQKLRIIQDTKGQELHIIKDIRQRKGYF